jgi:hypothetical protein
MILEKLEKRGARRIKNVLVDVFSVRAVFKYIRKPLST